MQNFQRKLEDQNGRFMGKKIFLFTRALVLVPDTLICVPGENKEDSL